MLDLRNSIQNFRQKIIASYIKKAKDGFIILNMNIGFYIFSKTSCLNKAVSAPWLSSNIKSFSFFTSVLKKRLTIVSDDFNSSVWFNSFYKKNDLCIFLTADWKKILFGSFYLILELIVFKKIIPLFSKVWDTFSTFDLRSTQSFILVKMVQTLMDYLDRKIAPFL